MVQKSGDHQLIWSKCPIIYRVVYISGACLGFLPTVSLPHHDVSTTLLVTDPLYASLPFGNGKIGTW